MTEITSREFQKEFGRFRAIAHREAVKITNHGREDLVLISAEEYKRLRRLDRQAMHASELSDEELADLEAVDIPAEAARYNDEITGSH